MWGIKIHVKLHATSQILKTLLFFGQFWTTGNYNKSLVLAILYSCKLIQKQWNRRIVLSQNKEFTVWYSVSSDNTVSDGFILSSDPLSCFHTSKCLYIGSTYVGFDEMNINVAVLGSPKYGQDHQKLAKIRKYHCSHNISHVSPAGRYKL